MAQRSRRRHTEATPVSPTTPHAPPCPEALSWPHPPAPLRGLCAGSRVAPSGPLRTTTPHGPHARTAAPGGHLAAFLPASGLCVSGLARAGQYQCQWASQRWPLAAAALQQLWRLLPGDPWHPVAWEARGAREAGVGGGRTGGGLGHPCCRPGVRGGPEHGAAVVGRGGGPCHSLFPVFLARRAGHAGPTG